MTMKQETSKDFMYGIDEVFDPENKLEETLKKANPKLALEITPTSKHDPCHDLFRIYTFNLLRELSKKFEVIIIYRDIQATTINTEFKKSVEENISLMRSFGVVFKVFYESEILQKHLVDKPEKFFRHIYSSILSKNHNHLKKNLIESSASLAVVMPLLEILDIDVLLCMEEEKENITIMKKIFENKEGYFPIIFYRSLKDLENKKHSIIDRVRNFPRIDWNNEKFYSNFKKYKTNFKTLEDWYKKLSLYEDKIFEIEKDKLSFKELYNLLQSKKISETKALRIVSQHLAEYVKKEGKFLELSSKELKSDLANIDTKKILDCLNTPSRINIIRILNKENLSAFQISKQINVSLPTTLFHLSKLNEAGIIFRDNTKKYFLKINRFVLHV